MSIADATSSRSSGASQSSSSRSTTSKPSAASPSGGDSESVPPVPQDRASVDRVAAKEIGLTEQVSNLAAGLAEIAPAQDPNAPALARIDEITRADHAKYGGQTTTPNGGVITPGVQEGQSPLREDIGRMWENVGVQGRDGRDDSPWSAAYISDVMKRAGVDNFQGSARHSDYVSGAIEARQNEDTSASHWGYRTSERAPQAGDLVCFTRSGSSATFDDQQNGQYSSHCDIVSGVRPGFIDTIGGNVGDSVSTRSFTTDENGLINDEAQDWIAVLAPQMLGTPS